MMGTGYLAEFVGTALLILFGNGVVANVVLARTKGNNSGWIVITMGWGLAVFIGAFCSAKYSGAHLNPAVTLAMAMAGKLAVGKVVGYICAQMLGAILGSVLVFLFYREHFKATQDADAKLACFCTGPAIRNNAQAFFCEVVGLGTLGLIPVGLLVVAIGLSLGGTTGYGINPARDLGPRIAHALLPVPGKRDSDWSYAWVPVVAPLVGAALAAVVETLLPLKPV
jgi:glycerol uptake facilitator protein